MLRTLTPEKTFPIDTGQELSRSSKENLQESVVATTILNTIDNKYDRTRTRLFEPNDVCNETGATEILNEWAELLRLALDEARTVVSKHQTKQVPGCWMGMGFPQIIWEQGLLKRALCQ